EHGHARKATEKGGLVKLARAAGGRHGADARRRRQGAGAAHRASAARGSRPAWTRVRAARARRPAVGRGDFVLVAGLVQRPPDDPAGRDDRQLEEDEQIEHRPAHRAGCYARRGTGVASKVVARCRSDTRWVTSSGPSVWMRSVPNASTLNEASAVPYAIARRSRASSIGSSACAATYPMKPRVNESPAPVGSTMSGVGYAGRPKTPS